MYHTAISLNYRRTNASTRLCTFPWCRTPQDSLREVNNIVRFKAFKTKKVHIPKRARFCASHFQEWENSLDIEMNSTTNSFTQKQIEDLITLITQSHVQVKSTGKHSDNYLK